MTKTLDMLQERQTGQVRRVGGTPAIRRRMLDMGIVPGAEITVLRRAPLRDPIEVRVKGYYLALREGECRHVLVDVG